MRDSTKDQFYGKTHEVKGAMKEKVGRATNNPRLQDQGQAEKLSGKLQKKIGDVEKAFDK